MRLPATTGNSTQNRLKLVLILGSLISLPDCLTADETGDLICEVKSLALTDSADQTAAGLPPLQLGNRAIAAHSLCRNTLFSISSETRDLLLSITGPNGTDWREISLKKEDGSRWAIGYINSISLSPDGTTMLVMQETGRLAVIREQSAGYLARSFQSSNYRQMDIGIESKNKQDIFRLFEFPGSIRILINPEQPYIAMHGLEIKSFCWLDENRFLAISYEDGRIIQFDTHTMRVQRTLRPSQWKWSRHTGNLQFFIEEHGKSIPGAKINLAETGKSIYMKLVGVYADQYLLYQDLSQKKHLLELKTGKEIDWPLPYKDSP